MNQKKKVNASFSGTHPCQPTTNKQEKVKLSMIIGLNSTSAPNRPKQLCTVDLAATENCLEELCTQCNRIRELMSVPLGEWSSAETAKYNNLDLHITRMMLLAEKRYSPKRMGNHESSTELERAGTELTYLLHFKCSQSRPVDPRVLETYKQRANFPHPITITGVELNRAIKLSCHRLEETRKNAYEHRCSWLEALAICK